MLFFFEDYRFNTRWDSGQRDIGTEILRKSIHFKWSSAETIRQFSASGLAYRRTDMLRDISLAKATEQAKTHETMAKSKAFWDTMEAYREEFGIATRGEAIDDMNMWYFETFETIEDIERAEWIEEKYQDILEEE